MTSSREAPTCLVLTPLGVRTDPATGRRVDLDRAFMAIKASAEEAGVAVARLDESAVDRRTRVGAVLGADLVVADVSAADPETAYLFGVRHGFRPSGTILVAEDPAAVPAAATWSSLRVRSVGELTEAVLQALTEPGADSPVFTALPRLRPGTYPGVFEPEEVGVGLWEQVTAAWHSQDWELAAGLLSDLLRYRPWDDGVTVRLAEALYHLGDLDRAAELLAPFGPETTGDPSVLRLWGAILRRRWKDRGDPADLDDAIAAHRRSYDVTHGHYEGLIAALLLNERALASSDPSQQRQDWSEARSLREQVYAATRREVGRLPGDDRFWALAALWEAAAALGDSEGASRWEQEARRESPGEWAIDSATEQVGRVTELLASPPVGARTL